MNAAVKRYCRPSVRWVGLGVFANNIINIGRAMEKRAAT